MEFEKEIKGSELVNTVLSKFLANEFEPEYTEEEIANAIENKSEVRIFPLELEALERLCCLFLTIGQNVEQVKQEGDE